MSFAGLRHGAIRRVGAAAVATAALGALVAPAAMAEDATDSNSTAPAVDTTGGLPVESFAWLVTKKKLKPLKGEV
ncbi:MAG: hypothetical protein HQ526_05590, partial [Actinobacteria bacterium]|nr:hypothetical protein [Actinomycetota bacterium]